MKILWNNKIYSEDNDTLFFIKKDFDVNKENLSSELYSSVSCFETIDGDIIKYANAKFDNIPDIVCSVNQQLLQCSNKFSLDEIYNVFWEDKKYEIEEVKNKIYRLKEELKNNNYRNEELEKLKDEISSWEEELKELKNEQEEYIKLNKKFNDNDTFVFNNINKGSSNRDDYSFWEIEMDVKNNILKLHTYDNTIITNDFNPDDLMERLYNFFPTEKIIDYIEKYKDYFDFEFAENNSLKNQITKRL